MQRNKSAGGDLTRNWGEKILGEEPREPPAEEVEIKMTSDDVSSTIAIDELRDHDKEDSPWFVLNGEVYDGTSFLKEHPGGAQSIISAAATDCTDEFMAIRESNSSDVLNIELT